MSTQNKQEKKKYKRPACNIEGCNTPRYCDGLCCRHWEMMRMYGRILERNSRDANDFIIHQDCVEIKMYGAKPDFCYTGSAFVDLDDYDKVKNYKWGIAKDGYPSNNKVGKLHRFVYPDQANIRGKTIDHIDQNKLNSRKSNLRIADKTENGINRGRPKNNTSGFKNVVHYEEQQCYAVFITYRSKRYTKTYSYKEGSLLTQEQALEAAVKWRNEKWLELDSEHCFIDC